MSVHVEQIMGMPIVVDLRDEHSDGAAASVFDWLRFVDETFSTYRSDSEISRLDRGELELADAHPDVREVLDRCEELRVETRGRFDAHYAGALDTSGLVKGWAGDRAGALLGAADVRNFAVNAGGDMRVRGRPMPEFAWRVGIQHPLQRDRVA